MPVVVPTVAVGVLRVLLCPLLVNFYEWLGRGAGTRVGTYSMATPEWVAEVLLDDFRLAGIGSTLQFDQTLLQITKSWQGSTVHDTLVSGFGRSDIIRGENKFTMERSESHLALVQWEMNDCRGKWSRGNTPNFSLTAGSANLAKGRQRLRDIMPVCTYLKFTSLNALTGQNYATNEAVWNKWMRVSNWIDLVLSEFDRQFTAINGWNIWPGHPKK
ncbi:hypothetical protein LZ30DRAFT_781107 [Colletotrichum cereale]|nr:hypothetical protein LZ30DRAFT_781107 [Colletotrichum cereale]